MDDVITGLAAKLTMRLVSSSDPHRAASWADPARPRPGVSGQVERPCRPDELKEVRILIEASSRRLPRRPRMSWVRRELAIEAKLEEGHMLSEDELATVRMLAIKRSSPSRADRARPAAARAGGGREAATGQDTHGREATRQAASQRSVWWKATSLIRRARDAAVGFDDQAR